MAMAIEKKWEAISPRLLTGNGGTEGEITLANTVDFKVKQQVQLKSNSQITLFLEIKRVVSPTVMWVGLPGNINTRQDCSAYTVADGATIEAPEQDKSKIPEKELLRACLAEEPMNAWRVANVDRFGNYYSSDNPMPVAFDGTINIGNVRTTAADNDPLAGDIHSSVRIGDGNSEAGVTNGALNVNIVSGGGGSKITRNPYDTANAVPQNTLTSIVSYTVPAAKTAILEKVSVSGENIATFTVLVNNTIIDTKRTYWGNFNALFDFASPTGAGYALATSDVVVVKVIHVRPNAGDFDARIQVAESP